MAQVIISHSDGRRYEVSEQAYTDLYEPFGFQIEGVLYNGASLPYNEANLEKANSGPVTVAGDTTGENAARAVILSDLEAEARQRLAAEAPAPASAGDMETITPDAKSADTGNTGKSGKTAKAASDGSGEAGEA